MKTTLAFLTLALTCIAAAQGQATPTIKGHHIGEGVAEYLVVANGGKDAARDALDKCEHLVGDAKNQKRYAKAPPWSTADALFHGEVETCVQISEAIQGKRTELNQPSGQFVFADKKLVQLRLVMMASFDDAMLDLAAKFGPPDLREDVRFQNGFGATFVHPRASWSMRPDVRVVASELTDTVDLPTFTTFKGYPVSVVIDDRAYVDAAAEKQARERKNSLD
jgi:hypothetical protein